MHMVFEDSETVASSLLIKQAYLQEVPYIHFAGGNRKIQKCVEAIESDEPIVVFLDVVPDNKELVELYKSLTLYFKNHGNVVIMPVLSMEYCILKAFENDSRDEAVRTVIDVGRYRDTQVYKTVLRGSCKSFERFCKKVLSLKTKKCMRNGQVGSLLSGQGLFYLEDCLCQDKASVCMAYPRVEKAWNLIA